MFVCAAACPETRMLKPEDMQAGEEEKNAGVLCLNYR